MKKATMAILLIAGFILSVSCFCIGEENKEKIKKYIQQVGSFVNEHSNLSEITPGSVEEKNIISILDSISETEAISALNTLSDTQDFENMGYKIQSGKADEQEMYDFLVYELIKNRLLKKWADKIGNQEKILMEKIFPILTNEVLLQMLSYNRINSINAL